MLNGAAGPGDVLAIVGAGSIGLAAVLTAGLLSPSRIVVIDLDDGRLARAREFGADVTINNGTEDAVARIMELTDGMGADVALEAVGIAATFELAANPDSDITLINAYSYESAPSRGSLGGYARLLRDESDELLARAASTSLDAPDPHTHVRHVADVSAARPRTSPTTPRAR